MINKEHRIAPRSFSDEELSLDLLRKPGRPSISICLPGKEVAPTVGAIVGELKTLQQRGAIDQIVVVDADSEDGTAAVAAAAGAEVVSERALLPQYGPVLGKGDAMWRALSVLDGELVCFIDADTEDFDQKFIPGLLGPLLLGESIEFVKGHFRRPFKSGGTTNPAGGGRVTELMARPLLNMFYPELAGFAQPLAGEIAARSNLLRSLPFATGYAVETGMLIDVWNRIGLRAMAQVDLGVRQNRHQDLTALVSMAHQVLQAVADRLAAEGRLTDFERERLVLHGEDGARLTVTETVERPPLNEISESAA